MIFGADYYPEHWDESRWEKDAELMQKIGFNAVRMGEFSWIKLEPFENQFNFKWLDKAIYILSEKGIKTILGTPTATPPKWLVDKIDIFQCDGYLRKRGYGSRRHYCYNNPDYQVATRKIVQRMAQYYKDNKNVIVWQIDNEFGCHETVLCYCNHCLLAFREWLKKKYKNINTLNKEWGTIVWSQSYNVFDEIELPTYAAIEQPNKRSFPHNPGLLLDFRRFSSDSVVNYQKFQIDILRDIGCKQPITHNFMGHFSEIDYFNLAKDLDFVSWDNYPVFPYGKYDYKDIAMAHDLMRAIKKRNFWVMEQQSGPSGTMALGDTPKPAQIRLWTYSSLAHGAEAIIYFRWRTCTFGNEEYWHGILDHDGIPRRRYKEIEGLSCELKVIGSIFEDSNNPADIAMVKSYDNVWSHEYQNHSAKFEYNQFLKAYYNAVIELNLNCNIINLHDDLKPYKLVLLPAVSLMTEQLTKKIEDYVFEGGNVVLTFRCGIKNWNNAITMQTLPGFFKTLSNIELEEYDALNTDRFNTFKGVFGDGTATIWCDVIVEKSTTVLARYTSDFYAGKPCITVNSYGKGKVYYIGCDMDSTSQRNLMEWIIKNLSIKPLNYKTYDGVEFIKKQKGNCSYIIILNHNNNDMKIDIDFKGIDILSRQVVSEIIEIKSFGVAIVEICK